MPIFRQLSTFGRVPQRVVSLVPSITESLFDLGLGDCLVGISDQCVLPEQATRNLPRVGGTKTANPHDVLATRPDLVLANQEENERSCIESLGESCAVWLAFPHSVAEAMSDLWDLVYLFHREPALMRMRSLQNLVDLAGEAAAEWAAPALFVPIWFEPGQDGSPAWWMTFNDQTYCGDLIRLLGGKNVFAGRSRRYPLESDLENTEGEDPGERDTRYPCMRTGEILAADPDFIFLPDEPFDFNQIEIERIKEWLGETTAGQKGQIYRVDGSLLTWHGTRIARALETISPLFFV